nr:hypothetical protein [Escherichia coli]
IFKCCWGVIFTLPLTGRATQADFQEAMNALRQACS